MRRVALAGALALVLATAGAAVAAELNGTASAVSQHTTYVQLVVQDGTGGPGLAAVAGVVACRPAGLFEETVLWFNDQLLLRRGLRGPDVSCLDEDETHVWATAEGAPDPSTAASVRRTGETFGFVDPNGQHWRVHEVEYYTVHVARSGVVGAGVGGLQLRADLEGKVFWEPYIAWVVEIGSAVVDPTLAAYYNFVTVVDLGKLPYAPAAGLFHGTEGRPSQGYSHAGNDPAHTHTVSPVHLWVAGGPETIGRTGSISPGELMRERVLEEPVPLGARLEPDVG